MPEVGRNTLACSVKGRASGGFCGIAEKQRGIAVQVVLCCEVVAQTGGEVVALLLQVLIEAFL